MQHAFYLIFIALLPIPLCMLLYYFTLSFVRHISLPFLSQRTFITCKTLQLVLSNSLDRKSQMRNGFEELGDLKNKLYTNRRISSAHYMNWKTRHSIHLNDNCIERSEILNLLAIMITCLLPYEWIWSEKFAPPTITSRMMCMFTWYPRSFTMFKLEKQSLTRLSQRYCLLYDVYLKLWS